MRKALSERLNAGDVVVVDDLKLGSPKTKELVGVLKALELKGTALIVAPADENLTLAVAQRAGRGADDERRAEHLRRAAPRQAGVHKERLRATRSALSQGIA